MSVDCGCEPGPESLCFDEVSSILNIGGEEHVKHVVLEPCENHIQESLVVVQDHVSVDGPHVVGGEGAADVDVTAGDGAHVVILVGGGDGKESHKSEDSFHSTLISIIF